MPTDVISLTEFGRLYCPPHSTSTSLTIDSDSKSNLKSTKSKSKGKAKATVAIHTTSTLTQALDFICTHLVGRQEVRKQRALINLINLISQCAPRPITQFSRQQLREKWYRILEEHSSWLSNSKHQATSTSILQRTSELSSITQKQTAQELNSSARRTISWSLAHRSLMAVMCRVHTQYLG